MASTTTAALVKGALAGLIGTAAMTAAQAAEMRLSGREPSLVPGQVAAGPSNDQEVTFDPTSGAVNSAGAKAITGSSSQGVDVSCPSSSQCTAVDDVGVEVTFDPTSGTVNAAGVKKIADRVLALSCPSSTQCTILNQGFQDIQALTFDPTTGTANAAGFKAIFKGGGGPPAPQPSVTPQPSVKRVVAALVRALTPSGAKAKIGAILKAGAYPAAFRAPSAGTVRIAWYQVPKGARIARAKKKPVLIASGSKTLTRAGKTTLKVKLTAKGKSLLKKVKKGHKLKLTGKGSFTPKGGRKTTRLKAFTLKR